jgi:hypothetical protein
MMVFNESAERGKGQEYILVNPQIVSTGKRLLSAEEGCLSLPLIHGDVIVRPSLTRLHATMPCALRCAPACTKWLTLTAASGAAASVTGATASLPCCRRLWVAGMPSACPDPAAMPVEPIIHSKHRSLSVCCGGYVKPNSLCFPYHKVYSSQQPVRLVLSWDLPSS